MLAFRNDADEWTEWTGQPRPRQGQEGLFELPRHAAEQYHPNTLAAFGLRKVTLATAPEGQRIASWSIEDHDGKPVQVAAFEDVPFSPEEARAQLRELLDGATASILAAYPEAERLAWDAKETEAAAFMADLDPVPQSYPLLRGEVAAERGLEASAVTLDQLATKAEAVLWRASQWRSLVSRLSGVRKRATAAIAEAGSDQDRRAAVEEAAAAIGG